MKALDTAFVQRTYRSTVLLALVVTVPVWGYAGLSVAAALVLGVALALALLRLTEWLVPQFLRPRSAVDAPVLRDPVEKKKEIGRRLRRFLPIVLVKYLSVGLVAFCLVRYWGMVEILAFCAGFLLVQANITMRVVSRMLLFRWASQPWKSAGAGI